MDTAGYLRLKAELLVEGVRATTEALLEVGVHYKEQNHGLFGWDFEDHSGTYLPDDFVLPDGTIVQFRQNSRSPHLVDSQDGRLVLSSNGERACEIRWLPRPGFYEDLTSAGHRMATVGQIGGEDCLFFCYQNYCSHFARGRQCLFCNLVSTSDTYDSVIKKKGVDEIGEVTRAGFDDGAVNHVLLTGGCFKRETEMRLIERILSAMRDRTGRETIPGTILPSPARTPDEIGAYHASGIGAIGFSMEIWDDALYRAICPGKSDAMSHAEFVDSIVTAVDVFGAGNVYGVLVMGLEPRDTFLRGVRRLTEIGANVVPFVWSPNPGSRLAGHRAPSANWYVDTVLEAADIVHAAGLPSGTENHCFKCDGNSLLHDALRLGGVE